MVSLARGAASPFKMLLFTRRRANQLTIGKKFLSREAASAAQNAVAALNYRNGYYQVGERKRTSAWRTPFSKNLDTLLFMVVMGAFVVSVHIVFHVFYHGIKLGLLFVSEHFTHFCVD